MKHLLKLLDLTGEEILDILNLADQLKYETKHGIQHPALQGKCLGMIFEKSSTRTRVSFEVGINQLGGYAVVLDEYGGFFGVVTLKDLLEQLVGEFQQEGELPEIQALDNGIWRIQGSAPLDDVAQELGVELPEEEYDTFGGYVFNLYGSVPQDGRKITLQTDQLQIQMVHIQDHRLEEALVTVLPKKEDEAKEKDRG